MIIKLASLEGLPKAGLHTREVHGSSPCVSTKKDKARKVCFVFFYETDENGVR